MTLAISINNALSLSNTRTGISVVRTSLKQSYLCGFANTNALPSSTLSSGGTSFLPQILVIRDEFSCTHKTLFAALLSYSSRRWAEMAQKDAREVLFNSAAW